jgi:hypothetical protein
MSVNVLLHSDTSNTPYKSYIADMRTTDQHDKLTTT